MPSITSQLSTQEQVSKPSTDIKLIEPALAIQAVPQPIEELSAPVNTPIVNEISTKDILVTDWQTASAKLEVQSNKVLVQTSNIEEKVNIQKKIYAQSEQTSPVKDLKAKANTVNDYQVEDIVEFEPIAKQNELQLGNIEQIRTNDLINIEPDVLLALPNGNYVIQIAAMANISILQDYVKDEQLGQQLWLYKTQRYGGDWYVLLKNQHFTTIEDARAEIVNLADVILRNTPFVKSIKQVKQEISTS